MQVVYLAAIFIILIIVLSTLRERLVNELSGTSLLLLNSARPGILFYSLLVLPGTIIHELSHWIVAEILQVRTGEITILPNLKGEGERERLGSVTTARTDPLRGFLIGVAPFVSGLLFLVILGHLLELGWGVYAWWQLGLIIYGIVVVGNSMMISREDRRTWPFIIVLFVIIAILLFKFYPSFLIDFRPQLSQILIPLNQVLGVTAVLNLGMIGGSYALRRIIEKVTKKQVVQRKG